MSTHRLSYITSLKCINFAGGGLFVGRKFAFEKIVAKGERSGFRRTLPLRGSAGAQLTIVSTAVERGTWIPLRPIRFDGGMGRGALAGRLTILGGCFREQDDLWRS